VVGLIRRRVVPIHHKPQLPTPIQASHVPIKMHMGMMAINVSHFTHNYGRANQRTPMPIRIKVLGRAKKGKVLPTKGQPPNHARLTKHHGGYIFIVGSCNHKYGNPCEIYWG